MKPQMYPRGFIGASIKYAPPKRKTHADEIIARLNHDVDIFAPDVNKLPFNVAVEKLYRDYIQSAARSSGWEFKEKFFAVTIGAFGNYRFERWVQDNFFSDSFTNTHLAFLEDTVNFIWRGTRRYDLDSWKFFFDKGIEVDPTIQKNELLIGIPKELSIRELIVLWCRQNSGFNDMVKTIQILFGS